jgi:thiol-disulfide isomerase/thioredoxin
VGDPAPAITVARFIKGAPVQSFEQGKLYVVEFWATWCPPCRTSIPHLTELQKKYKDVTFIGVSVYERDPDGVQPFVEKMGDKMDYRVAMDSIPPGKTDQEGLMAVNWMAAANQEGIPTAFIVDTKGLIAWIGHPMELEEALPGVVAGTWDMNRARAEYEAKNPNRSFKGELAAALRQKDYAKAVGLIDQAIAKDPSLEPELGVRRFSLLIKLARIDDASSYGERLEAGALKDSAAGLNALAWTIVDPDHPRKEPALTGVALAAALRADDLTQQKEPSIADTLGAAYFAKGDVAKAIETQQRAIQLAKGTQMESEPSLPQHLSLYQSALKP